MEKGSNPFEAQSKIIGEAKKIHKLCNGNYQMYVRRRKPDSLEVQQMKVTYETLVIIMSSLIFIRHFTFSLFFISYL